MGIAIYAKMREKENFDGFAKNIFRLFDMANYEKRESSNYINGEYYVGISCGYKVKISRADNKSLQDYQYCITIDYKIFAPEANKLDQYLIDYLARLLTRNYYDIAVLDSPYQDSSIFLYKRNPVANTIENEIVIEKFR